jgi:hypothetical protein
MSMIRFTRSNGMRNIGLDAVVALMKQPSIGSKSVASRPDRAGETSAGQWGRHQLILCGEPRYRQPSASRHRAWPGDPHDPLLYGRVTRTSDCRGCKGWGTLGVHKQPAPVRTSAEILEQGNRVARHGRNKCGQIDLVFGDLGDGSLRCRTPPPPRPIVPFASDRSKPMRGLYSTGIRRGRINTLAMRSVRANNKILL